MKEDVLLIVYLMDSAKLSGDLIPTFTYCAAKDCLTDRSRMLMMRKPILYFLLYLPAAYFRLSFYHLHLELLWIAWYKRSTRA